MPSLREQLARIERSLTADADALDRAGRGELHPREPDPPPTTSTSLKSNPMAKHLTRGDLRFLAAVSHDADRELDAIAGLVEDIGAAEDAAGTVLELSSLDALDDEGTPDDPGRLSEIRADLRSALGQLGRLDTPDEEQTDDGE